MSGHFLYLQCFIAIPVLNANSVDPDQMPCSKTSVGKYPFYGMLDINGLNYVVIYIFVHPDRTLFFNRKVLIVFLFLKKKKKKKVNSFTATGDNNRLLQTA